MSEGFGDLRSLKELDLRYCPVGGSLPKPLKDKLAAQGWDYSFYRTPGHDRTPGQPDNRTKTKH